MAKILLGCLHDLMAPGGIRAIKALLDFIYLAQYTTHDESTLAYLQDALDEFHKYKDYFIDVGCRDHLHISKIHSLLHYVRSIELFGTTDNYDTEMFERLHINFAKHGWQATNQQDEFPQMITWLSQQEKIIAFANTLASSTSAPSPSSSSSTVCSPGIHNTSQRISKSLAKHPNYPKRSLPAIQKLHQAPEFGRHLKQYLINLSTQPNSSQSLNHTILPDYFSVDVYNVFHFQPQALHDDEEKDVVKAMPISKSLPFGRFNTVIIMNEDTAEATGLEGEWIQTFASGLC